MDLLEGVTFQKNYLLIFSLIIKVVTILKVRLNQDFIIRKPQNITNISDSYTQSGKNLEYN